MKRKRAILIGCVACAAISVAVLVYSLSQPKEPQYQGKKLSEWLTIGRRDTTPGNYSFNSDGAVQGPLTAMGTNGLPFLVRWVSYETPGWKMRIWKMADRRGGAVKQAVNKLFWQERRAENASAALQILGRGAATAVPDLAAVLERHGNDDVGRRVIFTLSGLSDSRCDISSAIPGVLLAEEQLERRQETFDGPTFIRYFTDAPTFVKGLTNALHHANPIVRQRAVGTLFEWYGTKGEDPVLLRPALSDPDPEVRNLAESLVARLERHKQTVRDESLCHRSYQ